MIESLLKRPSSDLNIKETVEQCVSTFTPIHLNQMDTVQLLNRTDKKFVFPFKQLPELLEKLEAHYFSLEIDGKRMMRYETLYYDTKDYFLYHTHHNQRLNRYKIRSRTYLDSDMSFFEIKFKDIRKKTFKSRISCSKIDEVIDGKRANFLHDITPYKAEDFKPALYVYYSRLTLVSQRLDERVTIDVGLQYKSDDYSCDPGPVIIVEVKQDKNTLDSQIERVLKEMRIKPFGFSKYSLGIALIKEGVKYNNFKPKVLKMNRIMNV